MDDIGPLGCPECCELRAELRLVPVSCCPQDTCCNGPLLLGRLELEKGRPAGAGRSQNLLSMCCVSEPQF